MRKERRKKFLINESLQLRYMIYASLVLIVVSGVSLCSVYFGIWGEVLNAFSNQQIQDRLLIATRLSEYEVARAPAQKEATSFLSVFKQSEKLSQRQREIFKEILNETNKNIAFRLILLIVLIAWGSIYLSHKIAGPLYHLQKCLRQLREGDLTTRAQFRKHDEAQFLADDFNETTHEFDLLVSHLRNIIRSNHNDPEITERRILDELEKYKTSADQK